MSTYDYVVWKREENQEKIIERGEKWAESILYCPVLLADTATDDTSKMIQPLTS